MIDKRGRGLTDGQEDSLAAVVVGPKMDRCTQMVVQDKKPIHVIVSE